MARFRALMLWTDAWIADTKHLTRCERGSYHDLLVLMWRTPGCTVPNDDAWLAKHLGMTLTEVQNELRPLISEFCQTNGNRIWQKRLMKEFLWAKKREGVGSVLAKRRWDKEKDLCVKNTPPQCSTVTVTVTEDKKERASHAPKKARARSLPENWQPQLKFDEAEEFERFKDYARANAKQYADWDAAWRNWKRSPYRNKGNNQNGRGRRHGSVLDACDRLREKLNAQGSFAENYVPGSSGPKPLRLDQEQRPANLKLIPPR